MYLIVDDAVVKYVHIYSTDIHPRAYRAIPPAYAANKAKEGQCPQP